MIQISNKITHFKGKRKKKKKKKKKRITILPMQHNLSNQLELVLIICYYIKLYLKYLSVHSFEKERKKERK